ncbi:hypothetical protein GCM10022232_94000 [Streptomyces plumbiresistens]|uniref:Transposase n=1 Tax=Streptomyces plumbiresistens TaxID=511811 RepID=A0ABP7TYY9_9ACTN
MSALAELHRARVMRVHTFGWLMRSRRLARDYERQTETAEAMVLWSMTMVMSRRLAKRRR